MKKRMLQWVVNFTVRAIVGSGVIFLINGCLPSSGEGMMVGINFLTVLTSGFLGIPGVCVLYGIRFLNFL
ncbi:Pro-sigmaK processing inhibitor BofA [Dorea sp. OM02-2LB]|nr:pro-sigmaK processing inhibitor BofA family protein [uncultured Mediterraneibacter sp.]RGO23132.1 Pro-sigmaK processing inhibitor BofA [Dorea sp. OM02-2LB]